MTAETSAMVAPGEGEMVLRGGVGVVRKISSAATGGAFSVVEHPVEPGALAAPRGEGARTGGTMLAFVSLTLHIVAPA